MDFPEYVFDADKETRRLQKFSDKYSWALKKLHQIPARKAAVLIAIFQYKGRPHVILTERSSHLRTHAGDVALPGGKIDPDDESVVDAALRETEEEIGLKREHVQIVGTSIAAYSSIAKVVVFPVVGFIKNIENVTLNLNEDEVESVFAVPFHVFKEMKTFSVFKNIRYPKKIWNCSDYHDYLGEIAADIPVLQTLFCRRDKSYKIWGITGMMLDIYAAIVFNTRPALSYDDAGQDSDPFVLIGQMFKALLKLYPSKL